MTTIVNTPPTNTDNSNSSMFGLVAVALIVGAILLFMYFLLPVLRRGVSTPSVNVPDKIDVNVNTPQQ